MVCGKTDMIFVLRQLQEKCKEQNKGLFLDPTKAFDTVSSGTHGSFSRSFSYSMRDSLVK